MRGIFGPSLAALPLSWLLGCTAPLLGPLPGAGAEPPRDTLRLALGSEPQTLDPGLCTDSVSHEVISNLFVALVELDRDTLAPRAELAERWEVDESGRTWTFYLREAVWSDGTPLTAHDVVASWRRVVDPQVGSRASSLLSVIAGAEDALAGRAPPSALGVEASDARTLRVQLVRRAPYFLQLLGQPLMRPVPIHLLARLKQAGIDEARWTRPEHLVTSGPFSLGRWRFKRDLSVVKSATYFDAARVRLREVTWSIVESGSTLVNLYLTGSLDWTGANTRLPAPYLAQLSRRADITFEPLLTTSFYWLNCTRGILRDARARRALSLAIDRRAITERLLRGGEVPWANLVPPGVPGYPAHEQPLYDPNAARALWREAVAARPHGRADAQDLTLAYNTDDTHKQVAEAIQAMWAKTLGIEVALENQEWQVFLSRVEARDFDIARLGWVGDFADPISFLRDVTGAESGNNASGWRSTAFEAQLREAEGSADEQARLVGLAAAEETMLRAQPLIPLLSSNHASLLREDVCGLGRNILGHHPLKDVFRVAPGTPCPTRIARGG